MDATTTLTQGGKGGSYEPFTGTQGYPSLAQSITHACGHHRAYNYKHFQSAGLGCRERYNLCD